MNAMKEKRLELGMTQKELGDKVGLSQSQIARYEAQKKVSKPIRNAMKISAALGFTLSELYEEEEESEAETEA